MIKIHGAAPSPFVRKVRVALAEKGIAYELIPVMPFGPNPEYRKISPLGKIPCLEEDGFTVADSSVILQYLEDSQGGPRLIPADARAAARARFFEEYSDGALVMALGTVFFQRVVAPNFLGQATDEKAVAAAINEQAPPLLAWLEAQLADGREFLVGDSLTIADIAVASPFVNFAHGGETIDAATYPKLAAFVERILARDSFANCITEEKAMFGR
jgi:glutathione S-transferase